MLFSFWNRGRGTDYLIHVLSVLMPDEEGGREGKEDGWRSRMLLATLFFLLVLVLVLVFQAGGCGNQRIWECAFFLDWEWTSSWLVVAFRLGCKSTMKGSRRLEDRDGLVRAAAEEYFISKARGRGRGIRRGGEADFYAQLLGDAVLPETYWGRHRSEIARPLEDVFLLPTRLYWQLRYQQC